MSLLWRFRQVPAELMGLTLAIGVSLCRTLTHQGINDIQLKWPNDILYHGRKLCGILVEMHGETNGPYAVVVGLGLNVKMNESESGIIDQPWIAMENILSTSVSRNQLAAQLSDDLINTMKQFEKNGLETFLSDWLSRDAYRDQPVTIQMAEQEINGIARGIDSQGALLVETQGMLKKFYSGEISLRAAT
jgi:BirA family biotin operon repressor/biotin-[acetyl-CoA-carboxylase] ligase